MTLWDVLRVSEKRRMAEKGPDVQKDKPNGGGRTLAKANSHNKTAQQLDDRNPGEAPEHQHKDGEQKTVANPALLNRDQQPDPNAANLRGKGVRNGRPPPQK
jgi:hypothetical protein